MQAGNMFEVACKGCRVLCDGCHFDEALAVPICTQVMEHATSSGGATTLPTVSIDRGFWRATSTNRDVRPCYRADACLGGVTASSGYCRNGYEGQCEPSNQTTRHTICASSLQLKDNMDIASARSNAPTESQLCSSTVYVLNLAKSETSFTIC